MAQIGGSLTAPDSTLERVHGCSNVERRRLSVQGQGRKIMA